MKKAVVGMFVAMAMTAGSALAATAQSLPTPKDAKLVGEVTVAEVREFPEQTQTKGGTHVVEEAQALRGADRLYETAGSYPATVSFFDKALSDEHFTVQARTVTRTSTAWSLKRPDGTPARLAVRNTSPTTFEWVAAREHEETR